MKGILLEYLQFRNAENNEEFLFSNGYKELLTVRILETNIEIYNKRCGVMRAGIHIFRNVHEKKWIVTRGDIFRLQKILNHNSLNMVREYVDMFTDDLRKDFSRLNALEQLQDNNTRYIKMDSPIMYNYLYFYFLMINSDIFTIG